MVNALPLIARNLQDPIAFLTKPFKSIGLNSGVVDVQSFFAHVTLIAEQLPDSKHVINVCENRYLFLVSFCAAIVRNQTTLLPPNKNHVTQSQLFEDYPDCYLLHDGGDVAASIRSLDISTLQVNLSQISTECTDIPLINQQQVACISFTSGSTGRSKPILKYWRTLVNSTSINYRYMIPATTETVYQLATMPAQHMWGLETSILMPLFQNICLCEATPFYPHDIVDTLSALPAPRMLVSTPVHLRALASIQHQSPTLFTVLCATSPLTSQLAAAIEGLFNAPLREVYGCSEVGSMACRRTAVESHWRRFDGIDFTTIDEKTVVSAEHLHETTTLQDHIEMIDEQRFNLVGRASDLVKIAGKRGSLLDINQTLLCFDGLSDGVVFLPDSDKAVTRLCAIVELREGVDKAALLRFLRERLDSAFVPRPIYVVDKLPRESNGKLLRSTIDQLLASLKR